MGNEVGRRAFLGKVAIAAGGLAGAQALLAACGSGSLAAVGTPMSGGNCDANGSQTMVSGPSTAGDGHTHSFIMTAAQITSANASASFNTSSDLGHTHPVQLTGAQYASLASNQGINIETGAASDGDSHTHALVINCA